MKHFYICIFIFIAILVTGTAADMAVEKELNMISVIAEKSVEDTGDAPRILKDKFYSKKNMLLLFVSKEHIKDIETEIILLENAVKSADIQSAEESLLKIQLYCRYSKGSLNTFS